MDSQQHIVEFPIERGNVLAFAHALTGHATGGYLPGDPAPPTYAMACALWEDKRSAKPRYGSAGGGSGTQVHAEQHFDYARPVRVGETLTRTARPGASWEKSGRRGGLLTFKEAISEFRDASGLIVLTSTTVVVRTAKPAVAE